MSIRDFYNETKKNSKANTELNQLYKKPIPEKGKEMPVTQVFNKDVFYQSDVLFMPKDGDYSYILVCIDLYDGSLDAEPMKEVNVENVLKAFKEIFKRKYLKFPKFITFDKGNEFKGKDIIEYFTNNNTNVKYAQTGRSRQLATVERANQKIATILFKRMTSQELLTGETSRHWVSDLKLLIDVINENKKKPLKNEISDIPLVDEYTGKMLNIGQKVRILLDHPINNTNNARLHGKFRSTDVKWSFQTYKITEVLLKPGFPPAYLTDKNDNVFRTKNQLSKVKRNEAEPEPKYNRGDSEFSIPMQILDKKIENRKTLYLVRFKGFKANEAEWMNSTIFNRTKDLRDMRKDYNDNN